MVEVVVMPPGRRRDYNKDHSIGPGKGVGPDRGKPVGGGSTGGGSWGGDGKKGGGCVVLILGSSAALTASVYAAAELMRGVR